MHDISVYIEIQKEWSCTKDSIDITTNKVSKGSKCYIDCNDAFRLSKSNNCINVFKFLIHTLDRKKYNRKCKNGGIWSQSKAKVKCEKDGKVNRHLTKRI